MLSVFHDYTVVCTVISLVINYSACRFINLHHKCWLFQVGWTRGRICFYILAAITLRCERITVRFTHITHIKLLNLCLWSTKRIWSMCPLAVCKQTEQQVADQCQLNLSWSEVQRDDPVEFFKARANERQSNTGKWQVYFQNKSYNSTFSA